eukprot:751001-Hanusia_phi.AAC.2
MAVRINAFIVTLATVQILLIVAYSILTYHEGYGDQQKLDTARQAQLTKYRSSSSCISAVLMVPCREAALREPTPAPQEYQYGQIRLHFSWHVIPHGLFGSGMVRLAAAVDSAGALLVPQGAPWGRVESVLNSWRCAANIPAGWMPVWGQSRHFTVSAATFALP